MTWPDTFKLLVPALMVLVAIWTRYIFERYRERKALEETVWRSITDEPEVYPAMFQRLKQIVERCQKGEVETVVFDIPKVTSDAAFRLSQLDPRNALIYASYISYVSVVSTYAVRLQSLLLEYFKGSGEPSPRLLDAIELHCQRIWQSFNDVMDQDLKILALLELPGHSKPDPISVARIRKIYAESQRW